MQVIPAAVGHRLLDEMAAVAGRVDRHIMAAPADTALQNRLQRRKVIIVGREAQIINKEDEFQRIVRQLVHQGGNLVKLVLLDLDQPQAVRRKLVGNGLDCAGFAGTGKSSTVKAVANELAPDGLRLIEVKKNQLYQIPALMDELANNPLKFILFIDDLSFSANDDNFAALKAILEGGVGGRSHNVAVYATSNRRHLVKETMADRSGDDLHAADTRQELMSLAARFGLTVTFQQPDKDRYERILLELAKQYDIQMPSDQLYIKGAAFAIRAGGRSPRVAKQFVELLAAGVKV